ncbi:MAG: hypothetical protein U9O90_01415 [Euryarchaeota archaeon]|nr:hypothetical protein [Euryarchaeota archaeon]
MKCRKWGKLISGDVYEFGGVTLCEDCYVDEVIASLTGVDLALVVTEPTMSGLHDLERILDVTRHFGTGSVVCINKYDINEENSRRFTDFCWQRGIEVVGNIPYDSVVTEAMVAGKPAVEFSEGVVPNEIRDVWRSIK